MNFVQDQAQNQEIYVQFDKSFYTSGETMWFSIYNVRADDHKLIFGRRFMEFALIDQNKQVIVKERIRVLDGKSWGQVAIPSSTKTGNYLFMITYPFEDARNFLYRKVIPIYNLDDDFSTEPVETEQPLLSAIAELPAIKGNQSKLKVSTDKESYKRRETVVIELNIEDQLVAKASVVVRKKGLYSLPLDIRSLSLNPQNETVKNELNDVQLTNYRENKPLNWKLLDSHGLLLYELVQKDCVKVESIPYMYIPEDRTAHDIFEVRKGRYVFDATGLSGDRKSLYFTNFTFGKWGAEPVGELRYEWLDRKANYNNLIPAELMQSPKLTAIAKDYLTKAKLRRNINSLYGSNVLVGENGNEDLDGLMYRTVIWKNVDDYSDMATFNEFLKEVVMGLKIWEKKGIYDLRIFYVGGRYVYAPFFLVNGVPTWDQQRSRLRRRLRAAVCARRGDHGRGGGRGAGGRGQTPAPQADRGPLRLRGLPEVPLALQQHDAGGFRRGPEAARARRRTRPGFRGGLGHARPDRPAGVGPGMAPRPRATRAGARAHTPRPRARPEPGTRARHTRHAPYLRRPVRPGRGGRASCRLDRPEPPGCTHGARDGSRAERSSARSCRVDAPSPPREPAPRSRAVRR